HKAGSEIVLRGLYEVDILELASLFLRLGRSLGAGAPTSGVPALVTNANGQPGAVDSAWPEKNGWVRVRLSRLSFPRRCCGCGKATTDWYEIRAEAFLNALAGVEGAASFRVPACTPCQRLAKRLSRKPVFVGCATSMLVLVGIFVLIIVLEAANLP